MMEEKTKSETRACILMKLHRARTAEEKPILDLPSKCDIQKWSHAPKDRGWGIFARASNAY